MVATAFRTRTRPSPFPCSAYACVRVCVCACVRMCVCVRVCVWMLEVWRACVHLSGGGWVLLVVFAVVLHRVSRGSRVCPQCAVPCEDVCVKIGMAWCM
jgi:hypothetical protein